jgi:hypothetical protein
MLSSLLKAEGPGAASQQGFHSAPPAQSPPGLQTNCKSTTHTDYNGCMSCSCSLVSRSRRIDYTPVVLS